MRGVVIALGGQRPLQCYRYYNGSRRFPVISGRRLSAWFFLGAWLCIVPFQVQSQSESLTEVRQLIKEADYAAALDILREQARVRPGDRDVLFFRGLTAVALSEKPATTEEQRDALLDEAIKAFHQALVIAPDWQRARLEFAYALFLSGRDDLAKHNFERALVGGVPTYVAANIRRVLLRMRSRRRWNGYFSFSIAPDTNINNATESETIELFGLPFFLSETARARSGIGLVFSGGGEYQHPLSEHWRWRLGLDGIRHEYPDGEFDQTYAAVRTGPRYLLSASAELSAQAVFGRRWLASRPYSDEVGLRLDPLWRINRRLTLQGLLFLRDRRHRLAQPLDGIYTHYALEGKYLLTPTLLLDIALSLSQDRPQSVGSRNSRRRIRFGADVSLPRGWTIGAGMEWERTDYEGASLFVPGNHGREDNARIFRLRVLNRGLTFYGFSPQLIVLRELRASNSVLHGYQRSRLELRSVRQF